MEAHVAEDIPDSDLEVEMWPVTPVGGQHVGTIRGVKITHLPYGLVACANTGRSQRQNRQIALHMILGGITSPAYQ